MKGHRLHHVSRRFLLGALLAGGGQAALAGAPLSSLRPAPRAANVRTKTVANSEALIAAAGLSGKLGFVVADARTGRILESRNPVLGLPPASVAKALTALYALDALGPSHAFVTRLVATGPLVKGRIEGDIVLAPIPFTRLQIRLNKNMRYRCFSLSRFTCLLSIRSDFKNASH